MRYVPFTFLVLAIAFIALGISGQRVLLFIGIAFLVVALLQFLRLRR